LDVGRFENAGKVSVRLKLFLCVGHGDKQYSLAYIHLHPSIWTFDDRNPC
jgi:hypothetical protein